MHDNYLNSTHERDCGIAHFANENRDKVLVIVTNDSVFFSCNVDCYMIELPLIKAAKKHEEKKKEGRKRYKLFKHLVLLQLNVLIHGMYGMN